MSRTPGSTKAETHERIVETAARAIREHGYGGVSVADVMKQAGLTHGGFYAHFESREAMLEEALERAATESRARMTATLELAEPERALEAVVASYLSDRHVAHPEGGCSLAALGTETARQAPAMRRVATRQVMSMGRLIAGQLPGGDTPDNRDRALAIVSGLVGAVVVARMVDDPELSRAVRDAVAASITGGTASARGDEGSGGRASPAPTGRSARPRRGRDGPAAGHDRARSGERRLVRR